jgi:hypothetical protein
VAAALGGVLSLRVVNQDLPHGGRGHTEEMSPILPCGSRLVSQPKVRLVDQRGRIEGLVTSPPVPLSAGEPVQLVVDQREELVESAPVPCSQLLEQNTDGR